MRVNFPVWKGRTKGFLGAVDMQPLKIPLNPPFTKGEVEGRDLFSNEYRECQRTVTGVCWSFSSSRFRTVGGLVSPSGDPALLQPVGLQDHSSSCVAECPTACHWHAISGLVSLEAIPRSFSPLGFRTIRRLASPNVQRRATGTPLVAWSRLRRCRAPSTRWASGPFVELRRRMSNGVPLARH